jgi:ATP-dependent Clp protease protease subunit
MSIPHLQIPLAQPIPLAQQPRPPAFISFSAEIVPQTTEALIGAMTNFVNQGFRDITLLLSSPGGSVMHGITAYNVLRGLPITLTTHNVGNVDSIGTVIFLAGVNRYVCPQATFMLHGVAFGSNSPIQLFERNLRERLASVQADQERIKAIYSDRAGINPETAEQYFLGESTVNATDSVTRGIAQEIRGVQIPAGSPVLQLVFNRQGAVQVL